MYSVCHLLAFLLVFACLAFLQNGDFAKFAVSLQVWHVLPSARPFLDVNAFVALLFTVLFSMSATEPM